LGYAPTDALVEVDGTDIFSGVNNPVLGVGFDIVGDFALPLGGPVWGDALAHPNAVTLRKGTEDDFEYIGSSPPLSDFNFNIYQVYGDACPTMTSTPTPTSTQTHTQTFTNTWGSTATATPTQTQTPTRTATQTQTSTPTTTRTNSQTPTRTKTRTPTSTITTTHSKSQTPVPSKSITRTQTPTKTRTHTPTRSVSPTQTPTKTALHPTKKSVKVRITNYGTKAIVYVRNSTSGEFIKVYEKDLLGLTIPAGNHVMVGLSYSTGARCSKFYIYKFEVNGIGFENQYTPTQTKTKTSTQTQTQTSTQDPTQTQTRTRTPTPSSTATRTPTQTSTQTQTRTQTRTETPRVSQTQTRTQTRTQSPTQTQTRTQSPTRTQTATQTPTQTRTETKPIPASFSTDGSFMFRFTSLFYRAADFDMAVKIMINNARYVFNTNQTTSSLFDWNGEGIVDVRGAGDFAVPYCQKQVSDCGDLAWCGTLCGSPNPVDPALNNYYTQAWFYDGPSVNGQKNNIQGGDGVVGWRGTRLLPFSTKRNTNNSDFTHRTGGTTPPIPENVWAGLQSLFTKGATYDNSKLSLTATDDSQAFGGGQNYNVWPVENINEEKNNYNLDTQNYQIAQGRLDQHGCAYNFPNGTTEEILYNFDNITGSPILPGVEKSRDDFEKRYDANRTLPNTRYLRIKDGDIDITFSYVTELIKIQEGGSTDAKYLGARITLWTGSYQGYQPAAGKEEKELLAAGL